MFAVAVAPKNGYGEMGWKFHLAVFPIFFASDLISSNRQDKASFYHPALAGTPSTRKYSGCAT